MMRFVALVAAGAMSLGLPAHADGPGYVGTCRVNGGTLGGATPWVGEVNLLVVATTPGDTVESAGCGARVNDGPEIRILDATAVGAVAVGAAPASFAAGPDDTVSFCTHVDLAGAPPSDYCVTVDSVPICPGEVCGDGGLLDQVYAIR